MKRRIAGIVLVALSVGALGFWELWGRENITYDKVLVLKTGAEREAPCILGRVQDGTDLGPGQVRLSGSDSSLTLGGGCIRLTGAVWINEVELEDYIRGIVMDVLGG